MLEAITRLMPGFMGNPDSIVEDSSPARAHCLNIASTPNRPLRGIAVPDVLLSGDHGKVDRFRRDEALARTAEIRPDLSRHWIARRWIRGRPQDPDGLGLGGLRRPSAPARRLIHHTGGRFTTRRIRRNALYPSRHPRIRCRRRRFRRSCGFRSIAASGGSGIIRAYRAFEHDHRVLVGDAARRQIGQ